MGTQDHLNVDKGDKYMKKLSKNEMMQINAGGTVSGALINAVWNGVKAFIDVGRYAGSAIRRLIDKNLCKY